MNSSPIPNYPGYVITATGQVWSHKRKIPRVRILWPDKDGYQTVCLMTADKKRCTRRVHQLVAQAFIENPTNLPIINHKDGNVENNNVDNLEWCTYKHNTQHGISRGTIKVKGQDNRRAILTEEQARDIKFNTTLTRNQLKEKYGVCRATIDHIKTNRLWAHILP